MTVRDNLLILSRALSGLADAQIDEGSIRPEVRRLLARIQSGLERLSLAVDQVACVLGNEVRLVDESKYDGIAYRQLIGREVRLYGGAEFRPLVELPWGKEVRIDCA